MITSGRSGTLGTYKNAAGTDVANAILPPFYKDGGAAPDLETIKTHLKRELKIELDSNKEASLIKALTKPDDWLKDRKTALEKLADEVAPTYREALKSYIDAGFPYIEAEQKAAVETQAVYDIKMQQLDAIMPGAGVLLTGAVKERQHQGTKAAMYNGGDGIDYKAKYEKRQQKKHFKKAKKLELTSGQ